MDAHQRRLPLKGPGSRRTAALLPLTLSVAIFLGLMFLMGLGPLQADGSLSLAASGSGKILEDLRYQVNIWVWPDAVNTRILLKEVAPGRYLAEMTGSAQGFLGLISGNWRGSLSTEMVYADGKLLPLVYREASENRRRKTFKEYRFNYEQKKVELWTLKKDGSLKKRWETTFTEPFSDPLSFFYNRRLTGVPVGQKGECLKLKGIPYPKPEEIVLRVGEPTPEGLKVMVEIENRVFENERSQIYGFIDEEGVPTKAWTRVKLFGKVDAVLLPQSKRLKRQQFLEMAQQAGKTPMTTVP